MKNYKVELAMLMANTLYNMCRQGGYLNSKFETPTEGYIVPLVPGPSFPNPLNVDVLDVKHFIHENIKKVPEWQEPLVYFGVFPSKDGSIGFDVTLLLDNMEEAVSQARLHGATVVHDVANAKDIIVNDIKTLSHED